MGCPPGERLGHAMASVGPEIYVVGGHSISLPLSIAMESPTYMHVLDTRACWFLQDTFLEIDSQKL